MQGAVGVPHREVGEIRFVAGIAELAGQEGGAIESTVELVDAGTVGVFDVDGVEAVDPTVGEFALHLLERLAGSLSLEVATADFAVGEGRGSSERELLAVGHEEGEVDAYGSGELGVMGSGEVGGRRLLANLGLEGEDGVAGEGAVGYEFFLRFATKAPLRVDRRECCFAAVEKVGSLENYGRLGSFENYYRRGGSGR